MGILPFLESGVMMNLPAVEFRFFYFSSMKFKYFCMLQIDPDDIICHAFSSLSYLVPKCGASLIIIMAVGTASGESEMELMFSEIRNSSISG